MMSWRQCIVAKYLTESMRLLVEKPILLHWLWREKSTSWDQMSRASWGPDLPLKGLISPYF
jgi:hypothetical protein